MQKPLSLFNFFTRRGGDYTNLYLHYCAITALWALYVYAYTSANITIDTARDISEALMIAQEGNLPSTGPMVGSSFYLSPIWFYLISPAAHFSSLTVIALWVGLLAGGKFLIAWHLGSAINGPVMGWGLILGLSIPSWSMFEFLTFSHVNIVSVSLLGLLLVSLNLWRAPTNQALIAASAFGILSIHAHPTTAPVLLVVLPGLFRGLHSRLIEYRALFLAVFLFVLPFAPSLLTALNSPFGQTPTGAHFLAFLLSPADLLTTITQLMHGAMLGGMYLSAEIINDNLFSISYYNKHYLALFPMVAIVGLILGRNQFRTEVIIVLSLIIIQCIFLIAVRPETPYHMAYSVNLLFQLLAGIGFGVLLTRLTDGSRPWHVVSVALPSLLFLAAQVIATQRLSLTGIIALPDSIIDVRRQRSANSESPALEQLSPIAGDRTGRFVCNNPQVTNLHGGLTYILDITYGVAVRSACKQSMARLAVNVRPTDPAWVGLPSAAWQALDFAPEQDFGQWGLTRAFRSVRTIATDWLAYTSPTDYPPRGAEVGDSTRETVEFTSEGQLLFVVVTNTNVISANNRIIAAQLNGDLLEPVWQSHFSKIYSSKRGLELGSNQWRIDLEGNDLGSIGVAIIGPSMGELGSSERNDINK